MSLAAIAAGPASARALADGLAAGRFTSRALAEAFLERIVADRTIHAVCTLEAERARRTADAADARRAAGESLGPLDGLPITLKDAIRVAGSKTTYGLRMYRGYIPRTSTRAAASIEARGAVLLGRTAVPTGSFDWNGTNGFMPPCTNPHDPSRSPGGSSAGAAAAVAAGLSALDIGTDVAGSIRVPCHFCGVAGLRVTDGWLPIDDLGPEGLPVAYAHLVTPGPIARDVADLTLVLDAWAADFPVSERPLGSGPLAATWSFGGLEASTRTRAAMERWLADRGAVEAAPEVDADELFRDWGMLVGFEFARGMPWYARSTPTRWAYGRFAVHPRLGAGPLTDSFRRGLVASARSYEAALERLAGARLVVDAFFERHRALVMPICPDSAPPLALAGRAIDGVSYSRWHGMFTCPTANFGTPALSIPLPVDGMPIGLQIHGPRFSDRALVAAFSE
jgi:amidase